MFLKPQESKYTTPNHDLTEVTNKGGFRRPGKNRKSLVSGGGSGGGGGRAGVVAVADSKMVSADSKLVSADSKMVRPTQR